MVANDQITSVTTVANGETVSPGMWFDMNGLFALIKTELRDRPLLLEVNFDSSLGYPTRLKYGQIEVDAGAVITLAEFARR